MICKKKLLVEKVYEKCFYVNKNHDVTPLWPSNLIFALCPDDFPVRYILLDSGSWVLNPCSHYYFYHVLFRRGSHCKNSDWKRLWNSLVIIVIVKPSIYFCYYLIEQLLQDPRHCHCNHEWRRMVRFRLVLSTK